VTPLVHQVTRALAATALLVDTVLLVVLGAGTPAASAQTDPTALVGEGGSFLSPVTNLLLNSDTTNGLAPLNPSYSDSDLENAIADFAGSGPGEFAADFVVSERPLTTAEATTAAANGRSFAYVPFAATPVAIATFAVCNPSDLSENIVTALTFCRNIPLTPALVGEIVTSGRTSASVQPNTNLPKPLLAWNDSRLSQASGQAIPDGGGIGLASTLSPSAENAALMSLLDSDTTARELLDNALANPANSASPTTDAPSEIWPFHLQHSYVDGDEGLLGHELTVIPSTNAPGYVDSWGALGGDDGNAHDAFPLSAVWAGEPEGTPWNVPTAAIENASDKFVPPTEQAAAAAETGAGMAMGPTTNLVTFNPDPTDANAYNNYLMVESYLVVPTTGLDPSKSIKLAQFIRFILGLTGQSEIAVLGAAPATQAEVTAGLKVASELDAEAVTTSSSGSGRSGSGGSGSSATSNPGSTGSTDTGPSSGSLADNPSSGDSTTTGSASEVGSAPTLASTGADPLPLAVLGSTAVVIAGIGRWRLRRRIMRRGVLP